jgi:hypothetical protein
VTCSARLGTMQSVTVVEHTYATDGAQGAPRLIRRVGKRS